MPAQVISVVDGDTIRVRLATGEEPVRLTGIDTPESTRDVEPYGKEAAAFATRHLAGRTVYLELDVRERDAHQRLLAYVWLSPPASGSELEVRTKMFNAVTLLAGYAQTMTIPPNVRYADMFVRFQEQARASRAGMWSAWSPPTPTIARPGYVGNRSTMVLHWPTCHMVPRIAPENRVHFATREEALEAGYIPCRV